MEGISPEKALELVIAKNNEIMEKAVALKEFAEKANKEKIHAIADLSVALDTIKQLKIENQMLKNVNRVYQQQTVRGIVNNPSFQEFANVIEHLTCRFGCGCSSKVEGKCPALFHCAYNGKLTEEQKQDLPTHMKIIQRGMDVLNTDAKRSNSPTKQRPNDPQVILIDHKPVSQRRLSFGSPTDQVVSNQTVGHPPPIAPPPGFEQKPMPMFYNKGQGSPRKDQSYFAQESMNYVSSSRSGSNSNHSPRNDLPGSKKVSPRDGNPRIPTPRHDMFARMDEMTQDDSAF